MEPTTAVCAVVGVLTGMSMGEAMGEAVAVGARVGAAVGGYSVVLNTVTIPGGTAPGIWYIGIIVDSTNTVNEGVETNNTASVAIDVVPVATLSVTDGTAGEPADHGAFAVTLEAGHTEFTREISVMGRLSVFRASDYWV